MPTRRFIGPSIVALLVLGALVVGPSLAYADGGRSPELAPTIRVGVNYSGNNTDSACSQPQCRVDFWRLPSLLSGDRVTVLWHHTSFAGPELCLTGAVTRTTWLSRLCNVAPNVVGLASSRRVIFRSSGAVSSAFLQFHDNDCSGSCGEYGPYVFNVERIQHQVNTRIVATRSVSPGGFLRARARLTNGHGVRNGTRFTLRVQYKSKYVLRYGRASRGSVDFNLRLPRSTRGKVLAFTVYRGADSQLIACRSRTRLIPVA